MTKTLYLPQATTARKSQPDTFRVYDSDRRFIGTLKRLTREGTKTVHYWTAFDVDGNLITPSASAKHALETDYGRRHDSGAWKVGAACFTSGAPRFGKKSARLDALHKGEKWYDGKPCKNCGETKKFTSNCCCVECNKLF